MPASVDLPQWIPPGVAGPVLVGFSGGLDSTVLLHRLAVDRDVRAQGLRAVHVHHGLQPAADDWAAHAVQTCAALDVPLEIHHARVQRDAGHGMEAAARHARYAAFEARLQPGGILALAHHLDDQAETFLLRALRASGVEGLSAMRPWRAHGTGWLWRPLLATPRAHLLHQAREQALLWIEDPSNAGLDPDRNFLRHAVLPRLRERWPQAAEGLARSAGFAAQASDLLAADDVEAFAAARCDDPAVVRVDVLGSLPAARRARVLRHWIATLGLPPLPANGVAYIEQMLASKAHDGDACFDYAGTRVQRWRDLLHAGPVRAPLPPDLDLAWDGTSPLALPDGGALRLEAGALALRFDAPLRVHARRGGERIRLPGRGHHHSLKQVLQMLDVPRWERAHLPLLSAADGSLLAAGDRVLSAGFDQWLRTRNARLRWTPPGRT
ncbi:tRNA lysidine(34) synthetase TilS [Luteimonas yindakuii]|uniref:tRNA(Ile)-lysidine synthase n=1 Tax=Luteimonas yindakuii TaxID=2565782 RepID=A0A4Z1R579_9GAMM|nr:tRNA lysidine(34) synthetase TilS [Luteimonas yindakuii]TKS53695.1 tRNA lysidine(34) synthetase TilS [Luteimonas yindakuii]